MLVECMICLVRILDETVSDKYNVDVDDKSWPSGNRQ